MPSLYDVSAEAQDGLFEILPRIAEDSADLANRINGEFYDLFASLGRMPGQDHARKDLTTRPVLFFPMYSSWLHISRMCVPSAPEASEHTLGVNYLVYGVKAFNRHAANSIPSSPSARSSPRSSSPRLRWPTCRFSNRPSARAC